MNLPASGGTSVDVSLSVLARCKSGGPGRMLVTYAILPTRVGPIWIDPTSAIDTRYRRVFYRAASPTNSGAVDHRVPVPSRCVPFPRGRVAVRLCGVCLATAYTVLVSSFTCAV